jgi:hypothetical protein
MPQFPVTFSFTMMIRTTSFLICATHLLSERGCYGWSVDSSHPSRRQAIATATASLVALVPSINHAADDDIVIVNDEVYKYESRVRGNTNKAAVIREDYWYMMGKSPPRRLNGPLKIDDPQWNAFGSCETTEGGSASNSCTYVSLKQRVPAYSKYSYLIGLGAKEYALIGKSLQDAASNNAEQAWSTAAAYLTTLPATPPPPPVDALLKMVLFASSMLTSPNFSGISKELLVARFYVNEVSFAEKEMAEAIEVRDSKRALAAWDFGKDSWNSFFQVVNAKIVPKVGEPFELIQ